MAVFTIEFRNSAIEKRNDTRPPYQKFSTEFALFPTYSSVPAYEVNKHAYEFISHLLQITALRTLTNSVINLISYVFRAAVLHE